MGEEPMHTKSLWPWLLLALVASLLLAPVANATSAKTLLGAKLYFDKNLSEPDGQACASCHQPFAGFADPDEGLPVSEGVVAGLFGGRNAPSAAYMGKSPVLGPVDGVWTGGAFWDGRASGWTDGKPLIEQAKGPFLAPVEMHNVTHRDVVDDVRSSNYASLFKAVYGRGAFASVDVAYHDVADAIAKYESSRLVNTYSSRFDAYAAGARGVLTAKEKRGLGLFNGKALCSQCHPSTPGDYSTGSAAGKALFTDYSYDNLGLPANPAFVLPPLNLAASQDLGLGGFLRNHGYDEATASAVDGTFKVPTLRNIAKTAPYGHNGMFASLAEIVHFYNTRDVPNAGWSGVPWALPEVPQTVNASELGDLGLSAAEESDVVAFLKTLSDRVEIQPFGSH
jgi:cytochrome c peroxidase